MFKILTHNKNKYLEMKKVIPQLQMVDMEYPEIQADTIEEVIDFALEYLSERIEGNFIIDDSGLFIHALNDFPGVYSAYVFDTLGNEGILKLMEGRENRSATFKTVIGMHIEGQNFKFIGLCHGRIAYAPRGSNGFGYDPIFIPEGEERTFAEMSTEEKNRVSHRGKAIRKVAAFLDKFGFL
ncbi:non-canonical purine NTP pyrophosphatase, RdgB/HAM1 family [Euryarchaeota archaeon ex4484_178]|nr:MAG: non-canonical purine NTP pyrophosphatase, RdgB/HAM1 family [Euryarchaeota archaeon ex4484_178]